MRGLRRQTRRVFGIIVVLQLATSFGAIALLTRMGPAIARVAEENVESLTAVEQMSIALANSSGGRDARRRAFFAALASAEANVTEVEEAPLLRVIRAASDAALSDDADAQTAVLGNLRRLADVNRAALRRGDREAQRLAEAGAWAAVILAVAAFAFVRYVANQVDRQFVMPILEVSQTLDEVRQGDSFRRCSGSSSSPEIQSVMEAVNEFLDSSSLPGR